MRRRTPDSPLSSPGFFRFNKAVVVPSFDSLQVGCFFSSQLPAMTIAQQEKFNYTIFLFPGRHDISPSLTVLSHWGYNQTALSWPLRVHKKGNLNLGNVIFPIKYAECSPILHTIKSFLAIVSSLEACWSCMCKEKRDCYSSLGCERLMSARIPEHVF